MNQKIIGPAASEEDSAVDWPQAEVEQRQFTVSTAQHGMRVDRALADWVPELSRSYLAQLVSDGHVQVQGRVIVKPAAKLSAGAQVELALVPTPAANAFRPEAVDFPVVFEDDDLLVINKPAGLVVHPGAGNWGGTLLNGLLHRDRRAADLPRAGIVHRLDKNTSGLMVVAKSRVAMTSLVAQLAAREVQRVYIAMAHGRSPLGHCFEVDQAIGRDPKNRLRMGVVAAGKPAQTEARVLAASEELGGVLMLRCKLKTGRTHQIRVHMAWAGMPLVGDTLYGGREAWGLTHQALHAHDLALVHPVSGAHLHWWAPPPVHLCTALAAAGLGYNAQALLTN